MASQSGENDPFLQVQQDVLSQLSSTRQLFTSYVRICQLSTKGDSPELASARADLTSALETLTEDADDLRDAVTAVEHSPALFGLSSSEVGRRRRFVQEVTGELSTMRAELVKPSARSTGDLPDPNAFDLDDGHGGHNDDDYVAHFEEQQQQQIMRQQDEQLDGVFQTVGNLRRQADDMGRELEEQREMLEVVETVADRVSGRLQTGMQKLQYVVQRNEETLSSCCIGVLILVLIILLILLLLV
ncbi:hypothetical protein BROUX41_002131 [Berkeleyomyces rouxiae]|uniref:uncharacterized protein n=1 Tax=Berkeleyomyces rouxiae TaxID=2035830 RepID=UPI003B7D0D38